MVGSDGRNSDRNISQPPKYDESSIFRRSTTYSDAPSPDESDEERKERILN